MNHYCINIFVDSVWHVAWYRFYIMFHVTQLPGEAKLLYSRGRTFTVDYERQDFVPYLVLQDKDFNTTLDHGMLGCIPLIMKVTSNNLLLNTQVGIFPDTSHYINYYDSYTQKINKKVQKHSDTISSTSLFQLYL